MAKTDEQFTIDELAQRTGMTARNIRAHQSRGLLPPPEVRGRTGFYGPEHVARIEVIKDMQNEGFSLELIKRLIETSGGSSGELLSFAKALREPFIDEEPQIVDAADLARMWDENDPDAMKRSIKLGLLRPLGETQFEVVSPRLFRAGEELASLGVPAKAALELVSRLRHQADSIAELFVRLFLQAVWKPFDEAGRPAEQWPDVRDALERLRPLADEASLAVVQLAMADAVEKAFGRELERLRREPAGKAKRR